MRRLLAVLGRDVSASLSPELHAAAARACGLDIAYVPVSCTDPAHFHRAVDALRVLGARGANVTIPYKEEALRASDVLTETAAEIGAVNTLTFEAKVEGDNTDGPALLEIFRGLGPSILGRVQVLGAGGAARAAVWAARAAGAGEVHVCARRGAEELVGAGLAHALEPLRGSTLVVSTLPKDAMLARSAADLWIDASGRPFVLDLAYGPQGQRPRSEPQASEGPAGEFTSPLTGPDRRRVSPLCSLARERGLEAQDGLGMLIEQAARSLTRWTGGEVSRIRAAMQAAFDTQPARD